MFTGEQAFWFKLQNAVVKNEYYEKKISELEDRMGSRSKVDLFVERLRNGIKRRVDEYKLIPYMKDYQVYGGEGLNQENKREKQIIVSLTSYPARLKYVPITIGSLLKQTVKPDKIILWLGEEKEENHNLPEVFDDIKKCGVEIQYRPDIKTHTKWYYAFKEYPNDLIITVDDDIIYDNCVIEKLYSAHLKFPNCTPALRVHRMRYADSGELLDYSKWIWEYRAPKGTSSHQFFITGVGGVLHQPSKYCEEVMNLEAIKKFCESEDDFWLTMMNVLSKRRIVMADDCSRVQGNSIPRSQKNAMWKVNVIQGGSMKMIRRTVAEYDNYSEEGLTLLEKIALDGLHQEKEK